MTSGQIQMTLFSVLIGVVGIVGIVYVAISQPPYLHASRDGVPHLTPDVINPVDGEALDLNTLVRHYRGDSQ